MFTRVSKHIPQLFMRDKNAFTAMSKVGHVTRGQLKSVDIADGRLKNYILDGFVKEVPMKNSDPVYKLTPAGRELAREHFGITKSYHPQSAKHDLDIANKYFSLTPQERDTVITETEARDLFLEKLESMRDQGNDTTAKMYEDMLDKGLISCPDIIYTTTEGVQIAYETITNNYGQEELIAKEAYVEIMEMKYETSRV